MKLGKYSLFSTAVIRDNALLSNTDEGWDVPRKRYIYIAMRALAWSRASSNLGLQFTFQVVDPFFGSQRIAGCYTHIRDISAKVNRTNVNIPNIIIN